MKFSRYFHLEIHFCRHDINLSSSFLDKDICCATAAIGADPEAKKAKQQAQETGKGHTITVIPVHLFALKHPSGDVLSGMVFKLKIHSTHTFLHLFLFEKVFTISIFLSGMKNFIIKIILGMKFAMAKSIPGMKISIFINLKLVVNFMRGMDSNT